MTSILNGVAWEFGDFDEDDEEPVIMNGENITKRRFVRRLENTSLNLIPYKDNMVVFLFSIFIKVYSRTIFNPFVSYQPVEYDINNLQTALQLVGAIETFYNSNIEVDSELRSVITSNSDLKEWREGAYPEGKFLGIKKNVFLWNFSYSIDEIKMTFPGVYIMNLNFVFNS